VDAILKASKQNRFLVDFLEFQKRIAFYGAFNALGQVLLKIGAPGVPDFYQGTELWDFSLVDPDNRRPVDFERRQRLLAELQRDAERDARGLAARLVSGCDGRLKLWVTSRALGLRRARSALFEQGDYEPLAASGSREPHVVAFARGRAGRSVLAAVGRLFTRLPDPPTGAGAWGDGVLRVPAGAPAVWRDAIVGHEVKAAGGVEPGLPLAEVFRHLPVALLEDVP
jgi:(1->4)-alpha-D-glucan 1-alpha-D-glucosylmutase